MTKCLEFHLSSQFGIMNVQREDLKLWRSAQKTKLWHNRQNSSRNSRVVSFCQLRFLKGKESNGNKTLGQEIFFSSDKEIQSLLVTIHSNQKRYWNEKIDSVLIKGKLTKLWLDLPWHSISIKSQLKAVERIIRVRLLTELFSFNFFIKIQSSRKLWKLSTNLLLNLGELSSFFN